MHRMTPPNAKETQGEMRKRVMILAASVIVLHGAVIGIYYGMHIGLRPERTQQTFVAVWVVLTLLVVTTQMKSIRKLRRSSNTTTTRQP